MKFLGPIILFFVLLIPCVTFSQVSISEIMYDLEGSDTGREWIEIINTGGPLDISLWKLFENETNHNLSLFQGSPNMSTNSVAVIVDNPEKFLLDWPGFSGRILDSSFSLKNTGELLSIRNPELVDIDSVNFMPDWGGLGDGKSINKNGSSWVALNPTPGQYPFSSNNDEDVATSTPTSSSSSGIFKPMVNFPIGSISTKIIADKVVIVGADAIFEAKSLGLKGEKLENARHLWNFGDGSTREGEKIFYHYNHPGDYVIFLDVSSESFTATDKFYISVVPSDILISESNNSFIKIKNKSNRDINISFWILQTANSFFNIPKNTFIKQNGEITFSSGVTGLSSDLGPTKLLYPNGFLAYDFLGGINNVIKNTNTAEIPKSNPKTNSLISESIKKEQLASIALSSSSVLGEGEIYKVVNSSEGNFLSNWALPLIGIILLGVFSVVFIRRDEKVEGFTIIE